MEPQHITRDRHYLRAHRLLVRLSLSIASSFVWVLIFMYFLMASYDLGGAFGGTILVYALSQAIMMFLTPISAAHLRRGVKSSLVFGALLLSAAFIALGATFAGYFSSPFGWGIVLFAILFGAYRALYWIPYRLQAALSPEGPHLVNEILVALMPTFAGATLVMMPFAAMRLLFGAAALVVFSLIFISPIKDISERFSWGYLETFGNLFEERHRRLATRNVLDGIQSASLFLLWPLAVFLIVGRSYLVMGIVLSVSLLVLLFMRGIFQVFFRKLGVRDSALVDATIAASGWVVRIVAGSPIAVVFADSYSYVSSPLSAHPQLACDHAADRGSYIDECTALSEIALGFGRIVMCAFSGVLIVFAPLPLALLFSLIGAALASGGAAYLAHGVRKEAY